MKILYVHERFGAMAGAEANAHITATELGRSGHTLGILHGPGTGKNEPAWETTFPARFPLGAGDNARAVREALKSFGPEVVYVHKMADLGVIGALVESGVPLVRMVHDHDIYCMRSYKYNFFTRKICTRGVGPHCVLTCLASVARNREAGFPLKWVSYSDKKREVALNRRFNRMVVVTTYMRDELLNNGFDPARIEIHAPVPRMGDPNLRSSFSDRNLIMYAGQIIRGKGVDVLLEALALLDVKFECVILGDGNHRAQCEAVSRKLEFPLADGGARFADASADFKLAAAVAEFGMILRDSPHKGSGTLAAVRAWAEAGTDGDNGGYRSEFVLLVRQAEALLR